jgi:hypothetical protein
MSSDGSRNAGSRGSGGSAPGPAAAPVIAVRMESLLAWVAERVAKFPRDHRFTVGDSLLHACLDVTEHLIEASYRRDKRADLTAASRGLVRARVLMRLAHTLRCVSEAQHLHFAQESDEVGRMLGGAPGRQRSRGAPRPARGRPPRGSARTPPRPPTRACRARRGARDGGRWWDR